MLWQKKRTHEERREAEREHVVSRVYNNTPWSTDSLILSPL